MLHFIFMVIIKAAVLVGILYVFSRIPYLGIVLDIAVLISAFIVLPLQSFREGNYSEAVSWYFPVFIIAFIAGGFLIFSSTADEESLREKKIVLPAAKALPFRIRNYIQTNGYQAKERFYSYCESADEFSDERKYDYKDADGNALTFGKYAEIYYENTVIDDYKNAFCRKALMYPQFQARKIHNELPEFYNFFSRDSGLLERAIKEAIDKMKAKSWICPHDVENEDSLVYDVLISAPNAVSNELENRVYPIPNLGAFESVKSENIIMKINNKFWYISWIILSAIAIIFSLQIPDNQHIETENSSSVPVSTNLEETVQSPTESENHNLETEQQTNISEQNTAPVVSSADDFSQLAYNILSQRAADLSPLETQYYFADITGDEIPELIIAYGEMNPTDYQEIYLYSNGYYQCIGTTFGDEFYFVPEKKLIISCNKKYGDGCLTEYAFYQISGIFLTELDIYSYYDNSDNTGEVYFQHYDTMISGEECINAVNQYMEGAMYPIYEKY